MSDSSALCDRGVPRPRPRTIAVLDSIRVSWEWLCVAPYPVTIDGSSIVGLPDRAVPLDEVRARLLDRRCPLPVRDAVWAHLIARSRTDGPTWTVACAGMALPMLGAACRQLRGDNGLDRDDVASAVVTGFVAALASVDLDRPGLATSLRWAAVRAGRLVLGEQRRAPSPVPHDVLVVALLTHTDYRHTARVFAADSEGDAAAGGFGDRWVDGGGDRWVEGGGERATGLAPVARWESAPPPPVGGHPDLVLADAVADGVLSRAEAALIGETRLERATLAQAAARRGATVGAVTMQRWRAETCLINHLRPAHHPTRTDTSPGVARAVGGSTAVPARGNRGRTRPVTADRTRSGAPPTGRCRREVSPSVSTAGGVTARRRRRNGCDGHGGRVTR